MKKSRSFLALLIVSLSLVLIPGTAKADLWDVPVAPGESFRWVFVTSGMISAIDHDIATYNDFVNNAADAAGTTISGVMGKSNIADIEWKAIASTPAVWARDNVGLSTAGIYTPYSTLVANGTTDMFDGSLKAPIMITEKGYSYTGGVWTGSKPQGQAYTNRELGGPYNWAVIGSASYTNWRWMQYTLANVGPPRPLYAISGELTAAPVPGALILAATGLLSSTLGLKRWRRKC